MINWILNEILSIREKKCDTCHETKQCGKIYEYTHYGTIFCYTWRCKDCKDFLKYKEWLENQKYLNSKQCKELQKANEKKRKDFFNERDKFLKEVKYKN